jgi:hypothetical protein
MQPKIFRVIWKRMVLNPTGWPTAVRFSYGAAQARKLENAERLSPRLIRVGVTLRWTPVLGTSNDSTALRVSTLLVTCKRTLE